MDPQPCTDAELAARIRALVEAGAFSPPSLATEMLAWADEIDTPLVLDVLPLSWAQQRAA